MTPQAKSSLFPPATRKNLDEIAKLAEAKKATSSFSNTSQTAGAINAAALGAGAVAAPGAAVGVLAMQYATGKLLSSQTFTRWLASAPRSTAQQKQHIERLGSIASREPAIQAEVLQLQDMLRQAYSPEKLAAQDESRQQ
jgi:hypothetical protein